MSARKDEAMQNVPARRFAMWTKPRRWRPGAAPPSNGQARPPGTSVPRPTIVGVARLDIAELLANAPVEPDAYLRAERAARFSATPTPLRPVVVFETERGLLLADGYHRLAAARLRGERTIQAEVRLGSWDDALRYVAARWGGTGDEVPARNTSEAEAAYANDP
jgi:hypothetical protein